MKVEVYPSHYYVQARDLRDKNVVVIDVFRATTSIITALHNGCKEVIPFVNIEEAKSFSRNYEKNSFLFGGENNLRKIDGFDLTNSPSEYSSSIVKGKTLFMTTTNGTKAINKTSEARSVVIAAFINVSAVAEHLAQLKDDIVFVCAGTDGKLSMEDLLAAGSIISAFKNIDIDLVLDDLALISIYLYDISKDNIKEFLKKTYHYSRLLDEGFEDDIDTCLKLNSCSSVPIFNAGVIKLP